MTSDGWTPDGIQTVLFDLPPGWIFAIEDGQATPWLLNGQVPDAREYFNLIRPIQGQQDFKINEAPFADRHKAFLDYWTKDGSRTICRKVAALAEGYAGSALFDLPFCSEYGTGLWGKVLLRCVPILQVLLQIEIARLDWRLTVAGVLSSPRRMADRLREVQQQESALAAMLDALAIELEVSEGVAPLLSAVLAHAGTANNSALVKSIQKWLWARISKLHREKSGPRSEILECTAPAYFMLKGQKVEGTCGRLFRRPQKQGRRPKKQGGELELPYCKECTDAHRHQMRNMVFCLNEKCGRQYRQRGIEHVYCCPGCKPR